MIVTTLVVTLSMMISLPAAYALSRLRFAGSAGLATAVFLTYLVPETLLFIPLFKVLSPSGSSTRSGPRASSPKPRCRFARGS